MRPGPGSDDALLGLWDGHEAGVALVAGGRLIFALSEERPARRKRASGFPWLALARALEHAQNAGLRVTDVAVAGRAGRLPLRWADARYAASDPRRDPLAPSSHALAVWENLAARAPGLGALEAHAGAIPLRARLAGQLGGSFRLHLVPHHTAHAASAMLLPRTPHSLVLTLDAYGEGWAGSVRDACDFDRPRAHLPLTTGLAWLYGAVTVGLGFQEGDEGKVTGLAARGDPERLRGRFEALLGPVPSQPHLGFPACLADLRRLARAAPREDVAAALQAVVEARTCALVASLLAPGPDPTRLLLAGGLFANIRVNQALAVLPGVEGVRVFPHMGDGGLAVGAAAWAWRNTRGAWPAPVTGMDLGLVFDRAAMERALADAALPTRRIADPVAEAAARLARGQVLGWFEGRDEYGPRALGRRSILCSARDAHLGDIVNRRLGREPFMPFGPMVRAEDAPPLWRDPGAGTDLATMTVAVDATPALAGPCPLAVHLDGTSRPQVVEAAALPALHALLTRHARATGEPALINTSFNRHGEPIVHSPTDALRTARAARLDACLLLPVDEPGAFLVEPQP
ncbi:MAG: carbamoyltransferase C-terminal domain-containing protein [Pseudomonadota bacterium]